MKQKFTLDAVNECFNERRKELIDLNFKDQKLIEKIIREVILKAPSLDVFGNKELSFVESLERKATLFIVDLYEMERLVEGRKEITVDMMRRAGESIVDEIYRHVMSSVIYKSHEQARMEFQDLFEKRRRFDVVLERIRKSKSGNHQAKLAALYAFEEERMQYQDDVAFCSCVVDDDFKGHIDLLSRRCWQSFSVPDAIERARALLKSGRMKGKNFRAPVSGTVVDAEFDPDATS